MGGAASGRKGSAYERELIGYFRDAGWGAMKAPGSGSGGDADLPDVIAGRKLPENVNGWSATNLWAIEAKSGDASTLYVDGEEVDALLRFAERWGATPLLAARSTRQATPTDHFLVRPPDARWTAGGNYGLPVADVADRAFAVVGSEGVEVR